MARRGYGQSPFSNYDSWKTTDPVWESNDDHARCAYQDVDEHNIAHGPVCNVPYEDHNDEELGHEFVQPEIGSRE